MKAEVAFYEAVEYFRWQSNEKKVINFLSDSRQQLCHLCFSSIKLQKCIKILSVSVLIFQETPQEFFGLWAKFIDEVKACVKVRISCLPLAA